LDFAKASVNIWVVPCKIICVVVTSSIQAPTSSLSSGFTYEASYSSTHDFFMFIYKLAPDSRIELCVRIEVMDERAHNGDGRTDESGGILAI
jgi:hypothetical protein